MPSQTDENLSKHQKSALCSSPMYFIDKRKKTYWSIAAIVIVGLIGKTASNGIVHLLVVLLARNKGLGGNRVAAVQVEVCTGTTSYGETSPEEDVG
jgi:hypothetical protein